MREMKGQNPELESIGKFAASISGELDPSSIFRKALLTLNQVLGYERVFLYLIREDRLILEGQAGYEKIPSKLPLSGGVAASVVITGKPVFLKGGEITPPSTGQKKPGSLFCVPLFQGKEIFGILGVESLEPEELNEVELHQLEMMGMHLSLISERARLNEEREEVARELKKRLDELEALYRISLKISSSRGLKSMLQEIVHEACGLVGANKGGLFLKEVDGETLRLEVVYNFPQNLIGFKIRPGEGLCGRAVLTGEPLSITDYCLWEGALPEFSSFHLKQALSVPLKSSNGVLGAIFVSHDQSTASFTPEQVRLVGLLAEHASIAVEKARSRKALEDQVKELKRARLSLEETKEHYSILFEESPVALWEEDFSAVKAYIGKLKESGVKDLKAYFSERPEEVDKLASMIRVRDVNRAALDFHKAKSKEDFKEGLLSVVTEESRQMFIEEFASLESGKNSFEGETVDRISTGERRNVIVRTHVVPGYEQTLGRILVSVTDLTERKRAEEALKVASIHWAQFLEASPDPMWMKDASGRYLAGNKAWLKLENHVLEEVIGKTDWEIYPLERARAHIENDKIALAEGEVESEFTQPAPDGERVFLVKKVALRSPEGEVIGTLGLGRDITERKRTEQEIQKARQDLLFAVSHEMKTPLMTMSFARELLETLPEKERGRRFVEYERIWTRNLLRLKRLVDNLVDSQRVQATGMRLVRSQVDLRKIVESVLENVGALALYYKVSIQKDLKPVPEMALDREAVERLIENVLTNAIKFSPQGGKVEISLWQEKGDVLFSVRDYGRGIPPEEQPLLFKPFSRAHEAAKEATPGTGLGLYVSKLIAEAHGGAISLESSLGKGTRVTVRLPLEQPASG